jgi:hypothetical protein
MKDIAKYIIIEETKEKVGVFNFNAHYVKIVPEKAEVEKGFISSFSVLAPNFEEARTEALNRAQSLLRDLADSNWYVRLTNA